MATIPQDSAFGSSTDAKPLGEQIRAFVKPMASLKITVTVFALSLFLILVGSLAQARTDVWLVVKQYFRCWIAWVDVKDLFPPAFFPQFLDTKWNELTISRFPFPGGWTLGLIATINLLAAHGLKFKIQAKGARLVAGLVALVAGIVVTWFVIASGMNSDGFESDRLFSYTTIWRVFQVCSVVAFVWIAWKCLTLGKSLSGRFTGVAMCVALAVGAVVIDPLNEASMRILWQLMKAEFASLVLLVACWLLFKKRSGIVLLHAGVAVLMLSEVQVGLTVTESQFQLPEGTSANYAMDIREREIVVVDNSEEEARVVAIPEAQILAAWQAEDEKGRTISNDRLPFDVEVKKYYRHSSLRDRKASDKATATVGIGLALAAVEEKAATGLDSRSDSSTAWVKLKNKKSGDSLGTYMLPMRLGRPQTVLSHGKIYDIAMRFKRIYKPYTVTLLNVERRNYLGTATVRDYSSYVRLEDKERGVDREVRVWMNNPLRYRGETIYQTGYDPGERTGVEESSMQVVNNRGWMLPYMACMIVFTGLAVQFGMALVRYQNRRRNEGNLVQAAAQADGEPPARRRHSLTSIVLCAALAFVVVGYFGSKFRVPKVRDGEPNLYAFGKLPVVKGGRQQPLSSVAMNRLRVLTNGKTRFHRELRKSELDKDWDKISSDIVAAVPGLKASDLEEFRKTTDGEGSLPELVDFVAGGTDLTEGEVYAMLSKRPWYSSSSAITRRAPALWWMLDTIARRPEASRHRVIRIDEPQLLSALRLEPREGASYSLAEVMKRFGKLEEQVDEAQAQFKKDKERATAFQRRLLNLAMKVSRITQLRDVFQPLPFSDAPHHSLIEIMRPKEIVDRIGANSDTSLVLPVPQVSEDATRQWDSLAMAGWKNEMLKFAGEHDVKDVAGLSKELMTLVPEEYATTEQQITQIVAGIKEQMAASPGEFKDVAEYAGLLRRRLARSEPRIAEMFAAIEEAETEDPKAIFESSKDRLYQVGMVEAIAGGMSSARPDTRDEVQQFLSSGERSTSKMEALLAKVTEDCVGVLFTDEEIQHGPGSETDRLVAIIHAWEKDDLAEFNKLCDEHQEAMATTDITDVDTKRTSFEALYNHSAPAYYCAAMYLIAFAIACASLLGWERVLGRAVFTIVAVTFAFHTYALLARIYISGRPPVTNLYSSAVFIGWGAVLLALVFEYFNKRGIGNLVATAAGAATLIIAYFLGTGGDTFEVLQAVLDTQFWLATHVVSITLGYSATFLAGMFGIVFILKGVFSKGLSGSDRKELTRMIYGTLCFAMLFSFIGTILGGLWADDSWGRFWGWDTKENGAMMIVIWNAIVLHARWDNMVKDRGMAVLSVGGNIVTAWSWFGVNELGAGLHSYGFTEGALLALGVFGMTQFAVILIGLFPKSLWRSFQPETPPATA